MALSLLLTACTHPPAATAPTATLAPSPASTLRPDYEGLASLGHPVFQVDFTKSLVAITVRRGGSLARLGHDHVVASHSVQGWIASEEARADLFVPLADLSVDEPALRAEAGFDTQPSASDIEGTRANMQDKVLETTKFPYALIHVAGVEKKTPPDARLDVAITLRGVTRSFPVSAKVQTAPDSLQVSGSFDFDQSAFGIAPFSILNGAIQVQDRLSLRFSIVAIRATAPPIRPD